MNLFRYLLFPVVAMLAVSSARAQHPAHPAIRWAKPAAFTYTSLAFSPDGSTLARYYLQGVDFVDVATGAVRADIPGTALSAAFSPDGSLAACGGYNGRIMLLDGRTLSVIDTLSQTDVSTNIPQVAFTPDSRRLVTLTSKGSLTLWDLPSRTVVHRFPGSSDGIENIAISPDGSLLAARRGDIVTLFNLGDGFPREAATIFGAFALQFSPDGNSILIAIMDSASGESSLMTMDYGLSRGQSKRLAARGPLTGHLDIPRLAISPDGRYAAASSGSDSSLLFINVETGERARPLYFDAPVGTALFSPDGRYLAVAGHGLHLHLLDAATWGFIRDLSFGQTGKGDWLLASPDGTAVASATAILDDRIRVWDVAGGTLKRTIRHRQWMSGNPGFTPDGEGILLPVYCTTGEIAAEIWSVESGTLWKRFDCDSSPRWNGIIASDPDGRYLLAARGSSVYRLDPADGSSRLLATHENNGEIIRLAVSRDGRYVVTSGTDGSIQTRDMSTGTMAGWAQRPGTPSQPIALTPDGAYVLAGGADLAIHIWGVHTDDYRVLRGHRAVPNAVEVSPDGHWVIAPCHDGNIYVWRFSSGALAYTYNASEYFTNGLGWSAMTIAPDFSSFTTLGLNGAVVNWSTEPLRNLAAPDETPDISGTATLSAYPNPADGEVTIRLRLPAAVRGTLRVYTMLGEALATLASGTLEGGEHLYRWDASGVPAGLYQIRLEGGDVRSASGIVIAR